MTIQLNQDIQSKKFGGNIYVSIEGYTVHYPDLLDETKTVFGFHSFLSDDKKQMVCTVDWHMEALIKKLMKYNLICKGGRLLGSTDGCGKQYKYSTAIYFISLLSFRYGTVIDRAIGTPGYGKYEVDSINGVDKNIIYRDAMKQFAAQENVYKSSSSKLQYFS